MLHQKSPTRDSKNKLHNRHQIEPIQLYQEEKSEEEIPKEEEEARRKEDY